MNISFNRNEIEKHAIIAQCIDFIENEYNINFNNIDNSMTIYVDAYNKYTCESIIDNTKYCICIDIVTKQSLFSSVDIVYMILDAQTNKEQFRDYFSFYISYNHSCNNNIQLDL